MKYKCICENENGELGLENLNHAIRHLIECHINEYIYEVDKNENNN